MAVELRKVKGAETTYKVLIAGERPTLSVKCTFTDISHIKMNSSDTEAVLDIEQEIINHVDKKYTVVSALVAKSNKTVVLKVDCSNVVIEDLDATYDLVLKCRAVRYVENIAIIIWCVDKAIKTQSYLFEDDDEEDDDEDIEAPILELREKYITKLDAEIRHLQELRDQVSVCSLADVVKYLDDD
jgi:hypothetical protein